MKTVITLAFGAIAACAGTGALAARAPAASGSYAGHELASKAKIDIARAQAIALKARPGKVTDRELEKEAGGSGLRYTFDIAGKGVTYEVGVDAVTGKVLENGREGPHPD